MTNNFQSVLTYPQNSNIPIRRVLNPRAPTLNDYRNFNAGDEWLDTVAQVWYKFVAYNVGVGGLWEQWGGVSLIAQADSGTAVQTGGIINFLGTSSQGVSSSASGSTLRYTVANATTTTKGVASFNTTNFSVSSGAVSSQNFTITAGTGLSGGGSLTLGGSVTLSVGGSVATSYQTDSGTAAPSAGVLQVLGASAQGVSTSGATNAVTVSVADATTTTKGVASFNSSQFSVASGAVSLVTPIPTGSGGTGTSTTFTEGSVIFAGASGIYSQDNAVFFYDRTNDRLGLGTTAPQNRLDVSGALVVGSYAGLSTGPSNGMLVSGQVCVGTSSVNANNAFQVQSSLPHGITANGTITSTDGSSHAHFFQATGTFSPASGADTTASFSDSSIFSIPAAQVVTNASSYLASPRFTAHAGTIGTYAGFYFDGGSALPSGTLTTSYGGLFKTPAAGTTKIALAADHASIGSVATAPPANGLLVSGNIKNTALTASQVVITDASQQLASLDSLTAGFVLTSNGASAPSFQALPTGLSSGWVFIQSQTASGSSALNFTTGISSTYSNYALVWDTMAPFTSPTVLMYLIVQLSTDGGATYLTTGYQSGVNNFLYNSASWSNETSTEGFLHTSCLSTTYFMSGTMMLYGLTTGGYPYYTVVGTAQGSGGLGIYNQTGGGMYQSTATVNALRILFSPGTITSGRATLYGLAKA